MQFELKSQIKINTDLEIDKAVYKAQNTDKTHSQIDEYESRNWLLLNFLPLILKVMFTTS